MSAYNPDELEIKLGDWINALIIVSDMSSDIPQDQIFFGRQAKTVTASNYVNISLLTMDLKQNNIERVGEEISPGGAYEVSNTAQFDFTARIEFIGPICYKAARRVSAKWRSQQASLEIGDSPVVINSVDPILDTSVSMSSSWEKRAAFDVNGSYLECWTDATIGTDVIERVIATGSLTNLPEPITIVSDSDDA